MKVDKALRRLIPSASRLTYNPLFKFVVDSFDVVPRLVFKEFANIPPNHMRIRIGVGNRIFANQVQYLSAARNFWLHALRAGYCDMQSTIVDIGCGCGRYAQYLRDYEFKNERFSGRYVGIDIDEEMLAWCEQNFDRERFAFHRSTHASASYRGASDTSVSYSLPLEDATADFVFSTSLFTHLLERELGEYCRESARVLRSGGVMAMNCFTLDRPPPSFGDRHTFKHAMGNARVESLEVPEAAVAYTEAFLCHTAREAGFSSAEFLTGPGDIQPMLLCRK